VIKERDVSGRRALTAAIMLAYLANGACVPTYWVGGRLPKVEARSPQPMAATRPSVTVVVQGPRPFYEPARRITDETGLFAAVQLQEAPVSSPESDYTITMILRIHEASGRGFGRFVALFATALTLGIIPLVDTTEVVLTANVSDRGGELSKTYQLDDAVVRIVHFLDVVLPLGWFLTPERAFSLVVENLLRTLYQKIEADRLLSSPHRGRGGQGMIRLRSLLDWWGRSYHQRRMNVVEAALRRAGDSGQD
jgi:hypothetical protein